MGDGDFVGRQLGNYRLTQLLGQGGFAEVYLGEHIYLDMQAAIKVLRTQLEEAEIRLFRAEARTIARLVHPHIVRVLDFGVEGTTPFLVIDYAPNGTLRKRHPAGTQVPLANIVSYVNQVASALQYAHDQKVIHRDVKPENMLLGRNNEVLLGDFGIALVVSSHNYSTQSQQDLVGTIAYMAPEQIQAEATPKSDQYALGIVAYEWICGMRPFQGSITEVAVRHAMMTPASLHEKIPTLPLEFEQVVMKALAKNPHDRFPTIQDFASALERAYQRSATIPLISTEQGAPVSSTLDVSVPNDSHSDIAIASRTPQESHTPQTPITPLPNVAETAWASSSLPITAPTNELASPVSETTTPKETAELPPLQTATHTRLTRRNVTIALIGIAAASIAGGGAALLTHLQKQTHISPPPTSSNASLYTYTGHTGQVWSACWSPDSTRVASGSGDKTVQVWNANDGGDTYTYTGHADTIYGVGWSPDGARIASASYDTTVQVWNAQGGRPFTYDGHTTWVWTLQWSPDGTRIASAGGDKTVQVWDANTGKRFITYRGHTASIFSVAWSHDAKYIASTGADGTVQVWDALSGSSVYTYQPYSSALIWAVAWSPDNSRIASAGSDKTVQLWDALSGDHLYTYYGHNDTVYTVMWSHDGTRVASAGDDKTAQVWNASDGGNVYTYTGHTNSVRSVAWSPKNKHLVSSSWDKTVQVWQAG